MKKLALLFVACLIAAGLSAPAVQAQLQLPVISVQPTSYDFGSVPVGALATTRFTITNTGDLPLVVNSVKTKAPFQVSSGGFTVQPGQSRGITVGFVPTAAIQYNGQFTIVSNAHNAPSLTIPLSGMGQ